MFLITALPVIMGMLLTKVVPALTAKNLKIFANIAMGVVRFDCFCSFGEELGCRMGKFTCSWANTSQFKYYFVNRRIS